MKKQTAVIGFLTMICFLLVIWLPCQADDDAVYVCKNIKTGAPRLVKSSNLCKKTEHLVTLTAGNQGPELSNYVEFGMLNPNGACVNVSSTWTKLKTTTTSHSFTKSRDDTTIEVHVNSIFWGGSFDSETTGVQLGVRIDDTILPNFKNMGSVNSTNTGVFQSIYAVFQGLSAGPHTVSLWARTNGGTSQCVLVDSGGWGGTIVVKEN